MTLTLEHRGQVWTLTKHPRISRQLRETKITEEQARYQPWFLRLTIGHKRKWFKLSSADKQAQADARDLLNSRLNQPSEFAAFITERDARRSITVGQLAKDWTAANCPRSSTQARKPKAAATLEKRLNNTLDWWTAQPWARITPQTLDQYILHRRQKARTEYTNTRYTGDRSADLDLAALSSLGQWAVITGRVDKNPFEKRARAQDPTAIRHCHQQMPANDEELHAILRWLFTHRYTQAEVGHLQDAQEINTRQIQSGGSLAFMALTGLRPGEPEHLLNLEPAKEFPARLQDQPAGLEYPCPDGTRRLRVIRLKRGQNPCVLIHAALASFLTHWRAYLAMLPVERETVRAATKLFPADSDTARDHLAAACAALGLPPLKPHGFGRAYYVRVRRSQGIDDATIAVELGQSSNGDLIRQVYGDPGDGVGGNLYDWQPNAGPAAWETLTAQPEQILNVKFK